MWGNKIGRNMYNEFSMWDVGNKILLKKARILLIKQIEKKEFFICFICRKKSTGKKNKPYWYTSAKTANVCDICYQRILKKHEDLE